MFQPLPSSGANMSPAAVCSCLSIFPKPLPLLFIVNFPAATVAISLYEVAWSDVDDTKS